MEEKKKKESENFNFFCFLPRMVLTSGQQRIFIIRIFGSRVHIYISDVGGDPAELIFACFCFGLRSGTRQREEKPIFWNYLSLHHLAQSVWTLMMSQWAHVLAPPSEFAFFFLSKLQRVTRMAEKVIGCPHWKTFTAFTASGVPTPS